MPRLACHSCGRQIYTVAPLEALFAEERRCPRCGAFLDPERRDHERRSLHPPVEPARRSGTARRYRASGRGAAQDPASRFEPRWSSPPGRRPRLDRLIAPLRIAIVGFGLIGGSIARALRRAAASADGSPFEIAAWSPSAAGPRAALAEGMIDRAPGTLAETIRGADLVVLAAPPSACLELLDELAGPLREYLAPAATLTDVASTKLAIVTRADRHRLRVRGRSSDGRPGADRLRGGDRRLVRRSAVGHLPGSHGRPGRRRPGRASGRRLRCPTGQARPARSTTTRRPRSATSRSSSRRPSSRR